MLHVTNGQSAADVIRAADIGGDILPWNDVLHEGPVPDVPADKLREVRAAFLGDDFGVQYEQVLRDLTDRDLRLTGVRKAGSSDPAEIILWFEHDLYDQLQLLQILDALSHHDCAVGPVTLICNDEYLGLSSPARLRARFDERVAVRPEMLALARTAWAAFRSPDPSAVVSLLQHDLSALPYLAAALRRHLQQFPSTFNGLSRSEHAGLDAIAAGAARVSEAFIEGQRQEEAIFLGDLVFLDYMKGLASGPTPLVTLSAHAMDADIALTDAGRAALRGEADWVKLNGIDRWYGGAHLEGDAWRWDGLTLTRR